MSSPFDALQEGAFNIVTATMGTDASWSPSADEGETTIAGKVLFQDPSAQLNLGKAEFMPEGPAAEFYASEFPGLLNAVKGGSDEFLTIGGVSYYVVTVDALADGKTHKATLERSRV